MTWRKTPEQWIKHSSPHRLKTHSKITIQIAIQWQTVKKAWRTAPSRIEHQFDNNIAFKLGREDDSNDKNGDELKNLPWNEDDLKNLKKLEEFGCCSAVELGFLGQNGASNKQT